MRKLIEQKPIEYEEYWVLRGIKVLENNTKEVVIEQRYETKPTEQDIVKFLMQNKYVDFSSLVHNYALIDDYNPWQE